VCSIGVWVVRGAGRCMGVMLCCGSVGGRWQRRRGCGMRGMGRCGAGGCMGGGGHWSRGSNRWCKDGVRGTLLGVCILWCWGGSGRTVCAGGDFVIARQEGRGWCGIKEGLGYSVGGRW